MFRAEIRLRKRFGIFIRALRKMEHRKLRTLFKDWDESGNAIQLLWITVIIQSQHQVSTRLTHHPITRSNGATSRLVCDQRYLWKFVGYHINGSIGASIGRHKHLIWSRPQPRNHVARSPQIGSTIPGRDNHGDSHETAAAFTRLILGLPP
jgi:hypothetical protein